MNERESNPGPERAGLREAIRMAVLPARRPTEADRPPLSTFPLTRAAKAALLNDRDGVQGQRRPM